MSDELIKYYNQELNFLRTEGERFSRQNPKIANRLGVNTGGSEDPFVGRLLEAFSLISARIHHKLDHEMDFVIQSILNIMYPHYLLPIPSLSTLQLTAKDQLKNSYTLDRNTKIFSKTPEAKNCFFTTCYPITLRPLHLKNIKYNKTFVVKPKRPSKNIKSSLQLNLKTNNKKLTVSETSPTNLRVFISAEKITANLLYKTLFNNLEEIVISYPGAYGNTISFPKNKIEKVGFENLEGILPYPSQSFTGYRLLTEYACYPEKFLYFDINNLDEYISNNFGNEIELHLFFTSQQDSLEKNINDNSLALHCSPIINLFEQTGEPIPIDHTQSEYQVIADSHQSVSSIEIYNIESININSEKYSANMQCSPYFRKGLSDATKDKTLYWYAHRKSCWEIGLKNISGSELFVSFSEINTILDLNNKIVVTPTLLCTNRELTSQLALGKSKTDFQFWNSNHELIQAMRCIKPITKPQYRKKRDKQSLDLIAHISQNQLLHEDDDATLSAIKSVLAIYSYNEDLLTESIVKARVKNIIERHPNHLTQSFCNGLQLTLTIDKNAFPLENLYLFGCVFEQFLSKSCSINSFTKLHITTLDETEEYQWPIRLGLKPSL